MTVSLESQVSANTANISGLHAQLSEVKEDTSWLRDHWYGRPSWGVALALSLMSALTVGSTLAALGVPH